MTGGTATAPKQSNVDSKGHVSMSSKRSVEAVSLLSFDFARVLADAFGFQLQDVGSGCTLQRSRLKQLGIREHTDESCDLPKRYI